MPEGSSSAAPVMRPGPSDLAQRPSQAMPGSRTHEAAILPLILRISRPPQLALGMARDMARDLARGMAPAQSFLLPWWHALAFLARLGQGDSDGLLPALHFAAFATGATSCRATLITPHLLLDVPACPRRVFAFSLFGHRNALPMKF